MLPAGCTARPRTAKRGPQRENKEPHPRELFVVRGLCQALGLLGCPLPRRRGWSSGPNWEPFLPSCRALARTWKGEAQQIGVPNKSHSVRRSVRTLQHLGKKTAKI